MNRLLKPFVLSLCAPVLLITAAHPQGVVSGRVFDGPQQQQAARNTATVTGHVTCSDTQRAARFANVILIAVEQLSENPRGGFGRRVMARTDLDGNFSLLAEPGDYYVTASAPGYISTVAEAAARLPSGATAADLLSAVPQVHVSEGSGGSVNLSVDRGAVISGRLQWDDGTPAAGVSVNAMLANSTVAGNSPASAMDLSRTANQLGGFMGGGFQNTDDRGVFRISGLAPGTYWLRANVMTPASGTPPRGMGEMMTNVSFYAPGKVRRSEAESIIVKSGEEHDDVAFALNLSALHTVSGHVDGTGGDQVASGFVRVSDTQDSSFSRQAQIQPDGSFTLQWVPAGSYTLSVNNASNMPPPVFGPRGRQSNDNSGRVTFQPFQESLTVTDTDLSGIGISLTPASNAPTAQ